jgi:amidohydrolase
MKSSADLLNKVIRLRRQIHRYPELGTQEFKTSALVSKTLGGARVPFKKYAPTGVVGKLGAGRGPCIALRADMDALPIQESTSWAHKSARAGVMHACGHDAHTAMLLGAAMNLAKRRDLLNKGTVKFFFQPDEEGAGGAQSLIKSGVMSAPKVDAVFGLHVNPRFPAGTLVVKPGPLLAAVDRFTVEIIGEGGHGAYPHEGKDAIVLAAQAVNALQAIVSRRIDPVEPVVVTVGTIEGGRRFNVLAEKVVITGTVRTLSPYWHKKMPGFIDQAVAGAVKTMGGRYRLNYEVLSPAVINDGAMAEIALRAAAQAVGERAVVRVEQPTMGGEDFSEYLKRAPGCFVYVGTGRSAATRKPWHHPDFFLHEPSMGAGVRFYDALIQTIFERGGLN